MHLSLLKILLRMPLHLTDYALFIIHIFVFALSYNIL
jgi:hypothetical protein